MSRRTLRPFVLMLALSAVWGATANAQFGGFGGFGFNRSVGGVSIDPSGVLEAPTEADDEALAAALAKVDLGVPRDLEKFEELRAVSLKWLEESVAAARKANQPVPAAVECVAGLQRVRYVFAVPERHDVILVGPAEGWKIDRLGNVVGATTNRPVILLDDLMAAIRSGAPSRIEAITCSIDPTPEGLARAQAVLAQLRSIGNPDETASAGEDALGPQGITVMGALWSPPTSA